jgi:hypothetical protein
VTLVTIGELTAARVRLYGGTPPVTDKPQGWQVVKPSVIFEVTVNSGVVGGAVTHWVVWPAFLDSVQMMTCVEEDLCTDNMKKLWRDATRATSRIHYTQHQLSSCYMLVRFVEEHPGRLTNRLRNCPTECAIVRPNQCCTGRPPRRKCNHIVRRNSRCIVECCIKWLYNNREWDACR